MTEILETGEFLRRVKSQMRFGEFSRERLDVMRIEVRGSEAECDWTTRPADAWDIYVPSTVAEHNHSQQALLDALKMREILFSTFAGIENAECRAYRPSEENPPQLVMAGTIYRDDKEPAPSVASAMRATLLGFHFSIVDGVLTRFASECSPPMAVSRGSSPSSLQRRY